MCRLLQRNHSLLFVCLCTVACLLSCKGEQANKTSNIDEQEPKTDTLTYKLSHVRLESEKTVDMGSGGTDTTYFDVVYPVFENKELDNLVMSTLLSTDDQGKTHRSVEEEGKAFISDFDSNIQGDPFPRPWFHQMNLKVIQNTKHYLAFEFSFSQYTGGAHGNYGTIYKNYAPQKKDTLALEDVIHQQKMSILLKNAERIFRHQENIGKNQSLDDEFFFDDGKFALNNNFVLDKKGILFLYNVYEIKPYSSGITKLHIPYKAIDTIMTDLGQQIKKEIQKD